MCVCACSYREARGAAGAAAARGTRRGAAGGSRSCRPAPARRSRCPGTGCREPHCSHLYISTA